MKEYFISLYQYNDWANKRLFVRLPEVIDADPSILLLFSHTIMVELLWYNRVIGSGEKFPLWEPIPLPELIRHVNGSSRQWSEFLANATLEQLKRTISYVNTKGLTWENTVTEMITQTVNHSTHHRAQIVILMRRLGFEPPVLDYIAFARRE